MSRESFIFYKSYYKAIAKLPGDLRIVFIDALCNYVFDGVEPSFEGNYPVLAAFWELVKPTVDINNQRYENGKKGGRPRRDNAEPEEQNEVTDQAPTETEKKPKQNQSKTKAKPSINHPSTNPIKDVNVYVNDNVNANDNVSVYDEEKSHTHTNFLKILFLEKRLAAPSLELRRFADHYGKIGWRDRNGNAITNQIAAIRSWTPDKCAKILPQGKVDYWAGVLNIVEKAKEDIYPFLADFRDVELSDSKILLTCTQKLQTAIEKAISDDSMATIREYFGGRKLIYRIVQS